MSTFYTEISHLNDLVKQVYNTENTRLQKRQQGINDMIVSQKRLIALNQSYTSKMKKYGFILSIFAFALVILVMVITFSSLIPSVIVNLIIIIVIIGALAWIISIYTDIQRRDKIDFDELAIDSSSLVNPQNITHSNNVAGNQGDISTLANNALIGVGVGCIGRNCCPTDWSTTLPSNNIYYNTNSNTCQVKGPSTETAQP